ncbi:MAG TPA: RidA family protein [Gemmatimonadaceae bacterium]|nr:RidA family protein [Gemmatimonadaceae bacterium]
MTSVHPPGWPRPRGYANGTMARGRVVCVAGQVGWNPTTERIETDDLAAQAGQALRNVIAVLGAAGATPADVVRLTWYVTDGAEYIASRVRLGEAYRAAMGAHYPAMSVVVVAGLIEPRAKVEIEATAVVSDRA